MRVQTAMRRKVPREIQRQREYIYLYTTTNREIGRHRETQRHREIRGDRERWRNTERHREAWRDTERHRET